MDDGVMTTRRCRRRRRRLAGLGGFGVTSRPVGGPPSFVRQLKPPFQPAVQDDGHGQGGRHAVQFGGVAHGAVQPERQRHARVPEEVSVGHWPVPVVRVQGYHKVCNDKTYGLRRAVEGFGGLP